jgi:hypothetical protein
VRRYKKRRITPQRPQRKDEDEDELKTSRQAARNERKDAKALLVFNLSSPLFLIPIHGMRE